MSVTFEWDITKIKCIEQDGDKVNVVVEVEWSLNATDGDIVVGTTGTQAIKLTEESEFVEYTSLTKEDVLSWVHSLLGENYVNGIQQSLSNDIDNQKNVRVEKALPWQTM
jgi:hypothetical protein